MPSKATDDLAHLCPAGWHAVGAEPTLFRAPSRPQNLANAERTRLDRLDETCDDVHVVHLLTPVFAWMLCTRRADGLDPWLKRAASNGAKELEHLAEKLLRHEAAVRAALSLLCGSGEVGGQITKLRWLKKEHAWLGEVRFAAPMDGNHPSVPVLAENLIRVKLR